MPLTLEDADLDDQTFDLNTAMEWIRIVESKANPRDADIYPKLESWVRSLSPLEILDIGSGQGICSDRIDLNGRNYTGLEASPYLVERARQQYLQTNRRFIVGNVYTMPFDTGTFDAAFSIAVWHLLSDLDRAAKELGRVLKNRGHFLIITANPNAYAVWKGLYTNSKSDNRRFEGTIQIESKVVSHDVLYLYTLEEILNSLENANLVVQKTETFRACETERNLDTFLSIEGRKRS